jgi:hypothetical protein
MRRRRTRAGGPARIRLRRDPEGRCTCQREGAVKLVSDLLVHTRATLARCFKRKRFVEFQSFLLLQ